MVNDMPKSHTHTSKLKPSVWSVVDILRGPLETDVRQSASACWTFKRREITVRGTLLLRSHQLVLNEARFNADAETQMLGAALQQWQAAAQGSVATAALETQVAERRLIHEVYM